MAKYCSGNSDRSSRQDQEDASSFFPCQPSSSVLPEPIKKQLVEDLLSGKKLVRSTSCGVLRLFGGFFFEGVVLSV